MKKYYTLSIAVALFGTECAALIVIEEFSFTSTSVTVSLSGALEGPTPGFNRDFLFIASEELNENFYFLTQLTSSSVTNDSDLFVGGNKIVFMGFDHSSTGHDQIQLGSNGFFFSSSDTVSGTATFNFPDQYAELENLTMPALYWGRSDRFTAPTSGTFQTAIPEPSTFTYLMTMSLVLVGIRRMKRSNQS